jgi:hypothetical protein
MSDDRAVIDAASTEPEEDPVDAVAPPRPIGYDEFGMRFMDLVLHRDRVMESISRVLGDDFRLGPIGAGPGRKMAKVTATGTFGTPYGRSLHSPVASPDGEALPAVVGYDVNLPINVTFHLDLGVDVMRFDAEVLLPLRLTMELVEPLTILWNIAPPSPDEVAIEVTSDNRRAAVLQKLTGLDDELRRFVVRFVERELEKPHVRKAMRIDLVTLIDNAWEHIASQIMPTGPEDRGRGFSGEPTP